jgi:hypothetical protein
MVSTRERQKEILVEATRSKVSSVFKGDSFHKCQRYRSTAVALCCVFPSSGNMDLQRVWQTATSRSSQEGAVQPQLFVPQQTPISWRRKHNKKGGEVSF